MRTPPSPKGGSACRLTIDFTAPGNYSSRMTASGGTTCPLIRGADGTIFQTFDHPSDTLSFVDAGAGGESRLQRRRLFRHGQRHGRQPGRSCGQPGSIVVRSMRSDGFVTLVSNGAITEGGSDCRGRHRCGRDRVERRHRHRHAGQCARDPDLLHRGGDQYGGINLANFGSVQVGGISPA